MNERDLNAALTGLGLPPDTTLFAQLEAAYREDGRHYHTDRHIDACLRQLGEVEELAERPSEIALALWFHDAVYDTKRADNEEKSAEWARDYLQHAGAGGAVVTRIGDMILATKTHLVSGIDGALMVDADLSILGAPADEFDAYDAAIRAEYAWVADPDYRAARRNILESFLARHNIYHTAVFRRRLEARARANLEAAISRLDSVSGQIPP